MAPILSGISEKNKSKIKPLREIPNSYFIDFISIGKFRKLVFLYLITSESSEDLYL